MMILVLDMLVMKMICNRDENVNDNYIYFDFFVQTDLVLTVDIYLLLLQ